MPNYTTNLNLEKPLQSEQYDVDVFNANADKIDQFAGQTPPYALTADSLTTGAKINGVNFKGDTDVVTGAGFYYNTVTYGAGDLAFIYNQNNGLELHKSLVTGNIGHNPLTSTGYWEKQDLGGNGGRNVGEIISSTLPLTDAGLHLLDGARLSGDGIYKEFVEYIADLYTENPNANYFTDETTWQASVTQYGVCGKFVYDSVNNTVRLPKITGIVEGTTDVSALGDLVEAGLPNITGTMKGVDDNSWNYTGAFYEIEQGGSSGGTNNGSRPGFDASRSSSIYGNSTTVQPQTIKVLYYIVVATSTKTDIEVDIDEIATDLNGKADVDGTNMALSVKNFDGQWVDIGLQNIISNTSVNGTTDVTSSLSSILPDDNYNYEVLVRGSVSSSSTSGQLCSLYINSDLLTSWIRLAEITPRSNASVPDGSTCIIPVGTGRTISMHRESSYYGTANVQVLAYRRIGTNS